MRLRPGDQLVAMDIIEPDAQLLVISQRGYGKPTDMSRYRLQSRAGYGLQTFRITSKSGPIATANIVKEGEDIMIISERGQVTRTNLSELREKSRRTQGVTIVSLPEDDIVVSITSEEPKVRHFRDTTPRPAAGNLQPVVEEPTVELDLDDPTTNGHQANGAEQ